TAYPVFYDVDPTEIRKQSEPVEEAFKKAFEKHENKEAAGRWKAAGRWSKALNEAGNLAGWESKKTANGVLHENILVRSVHEGTNMMKTLLHGRKVLILLDDVDDREQLEVLADGLRVLEQRSLIYIPEDRELEMHDHIEEMGKNIVHRVNPDKPERHSR
nr:TMV resistance protein N-like [Tanacetum cinerariifolium]